MLSTELHCRGCPFWCQNAQSETNWGRRHTTEAENVAFSGGKRWWNGQKLSWNNPSPLAHHFHQVSLPGSSGVMHYHAKPYHPGQRLLGSVRGWKKRDRVTIRQVNKMHRRQSANVGLIISSPIKSAFSHYCWGQYGRPRSGLTSLATAEDDVDYLLSLQLRTIRTTRISSAFSHYCWVLSNSERRQTWLDSRWWGRQAVSSKIKSRQVL